jgi:hypothetical protein
MFMHWKITNVLSLVDILPCQLDTTDGQYDTTGYEVERRDNGFAITRGRMEHISGWSAWELLDWLNTKDAVIVGKHS